MICLALVDDDPMVRTGLRLILGGRADLTIAWEAADGAEALARIETDPVDVVLLDIRMPGTDGLAVLERLRGRPQRPKIVVLTTFTTDDYVVRALRLGANGFLLKDADPERLVEAIRRVHAGEPTLAPAVTTALIEAVGRPETTNAAAAAVAGLTDRELAVAELMADGLTNGQIASRLNVSASSVKAHLSHIFTKLDVDNRVSAAMAVRDARGLRRG